MPSQEKPARSPVPMVIGRRYPVFGYGPSGWQLCYSTTPRAPQLALVKAAVRGHHWYEATWRSAVEKDITIEIHIEEDESTTTVRTVLDLMGDHFEAKGRARRNPIDEPMPVVGEELALARALNGLQMQIMEAAQDKIARYLSL